MNSLEQFIQKEHPKITEIIAMNALQEYGVISDNCVCAKDVHRDDLEKAIRFLRIFIYKPEQLPP